MTSILIDSRSGSHDLINYPCLKGISQLAQLKTKDRELGDVMIYWKDSKGLKRRSIIELKSLSDFVSSMPRYGNRIARQVVDVVGYDKEAPLASEYYIAVYGTWYQGADGALMVDATDCPFPSRRSGDVPYRVQRKAPPIPYSQVESTFLTLSRAGVQRAPLLRDKTEAAEWIALLAKHLSRPPEDHQTLKMLPSRGIRAFLPPTTNNATKRIIGVASELLPDGGIGPKSAEALAKKFDSTINMINAEEEDFLVPRLIGGPTASRIYKAIRERQK